MNQDYIKKLFTYENGALLWNSKRPHTLIKKGDIAGHLNKISGYVEIRLLNKNWKAHRLIWLYFYGNLPKGSLDHINGIRNDNRIENLRLATTRENGQNRKEHRCGKLVGTKKTTSGKWVARIKINNKSIYLGTYLTQEEAHEAYLNACYEIKEG